MTSPREDPELPVPETPVEVPLLGPQDAGLVIASPAPAGRWIAHGERAFLHGTRTGVARVDVDGAPVARGVEPETGTVANTLLSPGIVRRERIGPRGVCHETALTVPTLPLVALQWSGALPTTVRLTLVSTDPAPRYRVTDGAVVCAGASDTRTVLAVVPPPRRLTVTPDGVDGLAVTVEPGTADRVTLLLARAEPDRLRPTLAAAAHLTAHARSACRGTDREGLVLTSGVREIDEGVAWARARLGGQLRAGADPESLLWRGLAACATGDRDGVDAALGRIADVDVVRAAIIAAASAKTFGDAGPSRALAPALVGLADRPAASDTAGPAWHAAALRMLADGLHGAVLPEEVERLRDAAASVTAARLAPGATGSRRLPVVGAAAEGPSLAAWLPSLLEGTPSRPPPAGGGDPETGLALAARLSVEPDEGWRAWRTLLAEGLTAGPAGTARWEPPDREGPLGATTAALLLTTVHGLLGLGPDAPAGRIRIAPRLPTHVTRFAAEGVTLGSARLAFQIEREAGLDRYTLRPTVAAVPPMAVLEARVEGVVDEVRIDGARAELETRSEPGHTVVPVQLPVDASRTVEIKTR